MSDNEIVAWLVGEVEQFLEAGRVGLYELIELLSGYPDGPGGDDAVEVAKSALDRLLLEDSVRLEWQVWGDPTYEKPADVGDITGAAWSTPTEHPYLGSVPA